jgi:hypothetical protein
MLVKGLQQYLWYNVYMPYHVGEKGSYGCSGYPALKDDGTVMGCHTTAEEAANQIYAINQSEGNIEAGVGITNPEEWPMDKAETDRNGMGSRIGQPEPASKKPSAIKDPKKKPKTRVGGAGGDSTGAIATTNGGTSMGTKADEKVAPCWEGYTQRGMKPGDNGRMVPNCVPVEKAEDYYEDGDDVEYDNVSKAEGYVPPAGARAAARRAIKFKEDGKATGAGTAVGWTRARQLANGETLSLSTVKRMYSYFSRHEVDKKGKDWGNQANPSNGYIMWLAWGGDAGYSWSRKISQREADKALFSDFGKDYTSVTRLI